MKPVIVLSGPPGSGKETLATHLSETYGFKIYVNSDVLRNICDDLSLPRDRQYLEPLAESMRRHVGNDVLAVAAQQVIDSTSCGVIVDGTRVPEDIDYLREHNDNPLIISISIEPHIAYQRLLDRHRPGDEQSYEEYLALYEREMGMGETSQSHHMRIADCFAIADCVLTNNSTREDFFREIDHLMDQERDRWVEGRRRSVER